VRNSFYAAALKPLKRGSIYLQTVNLNGSQNLSFLREMKPDHQPAESQGTDLIKIWYDTIMGKTTYEPDQHKS
jgi:hypothetical protein